MCASKNFYREHITQFSAPPPPPPRALPHLIFNLSSILDSEPERGSHFCSALTILISKLVLFKSIVWHHKQCPYPVPPSVIKTKLTLLHGVVLLPRLRSSVSKTALGNFTFPGCMGKQVWNISGY